MSAIGNERLLSGNYFIYEFGEYIEVTHSFSLSVDFSALCNICATRNTYMADT